MPPLLALIVYSIPVVLAFRSDRKREMGDTSGLFWPWLWYMVVASRPLGWWLLQWGVPLPGGSDDPNDGSIIERFFFGGLTLIGLKILARRRFNWGAALQRNPWITALCVFMAISILWSHYPFISFKRYIKVIGSIVMALVVLSSERPLEAMLLVIRRCLYIHLPMSILCTRYYRHIGVYYDYSGTGTSWQGIATTKNTLGQITMLGVVYFSWEVRRHWKAHGWRTLHFLYLLMAIYLLRGGAGGISMTSSIVCVIALLIFLRLQALRSNPAAARRFGFTVFGGMAALISLVLVHSVVFFSTDSFFGGMITAFGKDITMTDRTNIWDGVYAAAASMGNPLIGVGFGGFWIGRMANIEWNAHMTWVLGQGHSGYIDTFLQLGWIGSFLLATVLFTSVRRLLDSLAENYDFASFRITLFLTIIFINITESTMLRGDHNMWFLFMIVIWMVPATRPAEVMPSKAVPSF